MSNQGPIRPPARPRQTGRLGANRPRVLVIENEPTTRRLYMDLLSHWGFQTFTVEASGPPLLDLAVAAARRHRCHLALVDMRLLDDNDPNDYSGLELVPRLKPTEALMVSGYGDTKTASEAIIARGALDFIGKGDGPDILDNKLERAAHLVCARKRSLRIQPAQLTARLVRDFFPGDAEVPLDETDDLLARLYPNARELRLEILEIGGQHSLTRVPRPRSSILKIWPDGRQPDLVKLARASKIEGEIKRFKEHVDKRLVGHFNPILNGHHLLWDLGAAAFTFIGVTDIQPFGQYFARASTADIVYSLEHFFSSTWSHLYQQHTHFRRKQDIFEAYCAVWDQQWVARLKDFTPRYPQTEMPDRLQSLGAPEPKNWLMKRLQLQGDREEDTRPVHPTASGRVDRPSTALAITHGDLHADNMLVDGNRHVWVIDFERSGPGPICQDFTELEADIISRLAGIAEHDFASLFGLCGWAASHTTLGEIALPDFRLSSEMEKAMQVIAALRRLARRCGGGEDARPYLWGLLFNAMFRATLLPADEEHHLAQQRALMFASILCHRLDHWKEPWPPAGWPPFFKTP